MSNNPFIYTAAADLEPKKLSDFFIDNDNSRIIDSSHNVFIGGYRGAGKSMLMLYNSFPYKNIEGDSTFERIGVHVNCGSPFFAKIDVGFNDNKFQVATILESFLVLTMAMSLIDVIKGIRFCDYDLELIKTEFNNYFDDFQSETIDAVLGNIHTWIRKEIIKSQVEVQTGVEKFVSFKVYSYLSLIDVIVNILKQTSVLKNTHFMFLMDDAVMMSIQQQKTVNTWISYRDTTNVSFKVAITSADEYSFSTGRGSIILENHDYIMLDLEKNFFSSNTEFYEFAKRVVTKRFELLGINVSVDEFFPVPEDFTKRLEVIKEKFISGEYPEGDGKIKQQRIDSVSKYMRAIYFRLIHENPKANLPKLAYTGFKVLTNISTGVIRNLLVPCYKMYEIEHTNNPQTTKISEEVQYQALKNESDRAWSDIDNLSSRIDDCTENDAQKLKNILNNFGEYLKARLLNTSSSEKRILTFTIEDLNKPNNKNIKDEINRIINIGVQAGLLYTRQGADHSGGKTKYYTPNRILWVSRGLDPVGQNGRKNFPASEFYKMMTNQEFNHKEYNKNQLEIPL